MHKSLWGSNHIAWSAHFVLLIPLQIKFEFSLNAVAAHRLMLRLFSFFASCKMLKRFYLAWGWMDVLDNGHCKWKWSYVGVVYLVANGEKDYWPFDLRMIVKDPATMRIQNREQTPYHHCHTSTPQQMAGKPERIVLRCSHNKEIVNG